MFFGSAPNPDLRKLRSLACSNHTFFDKLLNPPALLSFPSSYTSQLHLHTQLQSFDFHHYNNLLHQTHINTFIKQHQRWLEPNRLLVSNHHSHHYDLCTVAGDGCRRVFTMLHQPHREFNFATRPILKDHRTSSLTIIHRQVHWWQGPS